MFCLHALEPPGFFLSAPYRTGLCLHAPQRTEHRLRRKEVLSVALKGSACSAKRYRDSYDNFLDI